MEGPDLSSTIIANGQMTLGKLRFLSKTEGSLLVGKKEERIFYSLESAQKKYYSISIKYN